METMSDMPASACSRMASVANGAGYEYEPGVGAGCGYGFSSGLEVRYFVHELGPAAVGVYGGNHVGAVFEDALCLE